MFLHPHKLGKHFLKLLNCIIKDWSNNIQYSKLQDNALIFSRYFFSKDFWMKWSLTYRVFVGHWKHNLSLHVSINISRSVSGQITLQFIRGWTVDCDTKVYLSRCFGTKCGVIQQSDDIYSCTSECKHTLYISLQAKQRTERFVCYRADCLYLSGLMKLTQIYFIYEMHHLQY